MTGGSVSTIEKAAAAVHQAYLDTCDRLGWDVRPANRVGYEGLSDEAKELDRATARAALSAFGVDEPQVYAWQDLAEAARRLLDAATDPDLRTAESDMEMALTRLDQGGAQ